MVRRYIAVACLVALSGGLAYAGAANAVGQKGRLFSPGVVRIKAGEALHFNNDDSVTHHVYSLTKGQEFDLETTKPGQSVTHTFGKAGRVEVRCGLHPGMRLVVNVE